MNNISCEEGEVINTEDDGKIKNLISNKFALVYNDNKIKSQYDIDNNNFKFDENIIKYEIGNLENWKSCFMGLYSC